MAIQITTALKKLLKLRKRIRCICGGTSAGKTIAVLMILIDKAQTNKNLTIDVMSESFPHLEGGAIKDFKTIMMEREYWDDEQWNETKHFYTFPTGTVIKFISVDKIGKAHGPRRDILFVNEAPYIPWEIFLQLWQRTSGDVWIDWNPSTEFWYYSEIKDKIDHDFITLTYLDNEGLPQTVKELIESRKENKNWWTVYGLGQLGNVEGRIYTNWQIIDEVPHEAKLWRRGLDFGFSNDPTVIQDIYKYNGGFIVDERLRRKGMHNDRIADFLNELNEPDTLVIADSAEPKSIDEIASYGVNIIGADKGPGSVKKGIDYVQSQKISVTKRSVNTIKSYRNYMWKTDNNGKPLNEPHHDFSDEMDAIRYPIAGTAEEKTTEDEIKSILAALPQENILNRRGFY